MKVLIRYYKKTYHSELYFIHEKRQLIAIKKMLVSNDARLIFITVNDKQNYKIDCYNLIEIESTFNNIEGITVNGKSLFLSTISIHAEG
jgi:uncharacterized pyridoxamine 5'-phosphate oxidase family protein